VLIVVYFPPSLQYITPSPEQVPRQQQFVAGERVRVVRHAATLYEAVQLAAHVQEALEFGGHRAAVHLKCGMVFVEKVKRTRTKIKKDNKPKDKRETRANVRGKKHAVNLLAARILKAHQ